jgi:hypothetical protein
MFIKALYHCKKEFYGKYRNSCRYTFTQNLYFQTKKLFFFKSNNKIKDPLKVDKQ